MIFLIKTELKLGLPQRIRFLHLTDHHLPYADARDDVRKRTLANNRREVFERERQERLKNVGLADPFSGDFFARSLEESIEYAEKNDEMILYSGDLIDFISQQNLDYAKKILDGRDCLFAAGNHEFSKYVGEAKEDDAYKLDSLPLVQPYFPNDLTFASKQVAGVNLIAMDNSYYRFTEHQHDLLRKEVEKGLPILLLLHTPLYQEALYHSARSIRPGCAYLVGCPADKMSDYPQDRFEQQKADVATIEMMDTIRTQPLIKAIFAGHFHYNDEGEFAQGKMQYITGGGFAGFGREIILE